MTRELVAWNDLRPGDVVVCCAGTVWWQPATVIGTSGDGPTDEHFLIDYVSSSGVIKDAAYAKDGMWLVERPHQYVATISGPPVSEQAVQP